MILRIHMRLQYYNLLPKINSKYYKSFISFLYFIQSEKNRFKSPYDIAEIVLKN